MIIIIFFVLLNYFWLSNDPDESASWYCDQHCFKIGGEVIESIWDSVSILAPELLEAATDEGIGMSFRRNRHAPMAIDGTASGLWHPLSVWHGLCMANMKRGLINAMAIFKEHKKRTGCIHIASKDCKFLLKNIHRVDFQTDTWRRWYMTQNGSSSKTKKQERMNWCKKHAITNTKRSVLIVNRNQCSMTPPPICVFDGCRIENDLVGSYKKYYHEKINTISGGMRYYYTKPPSWLKHKGLVKTKKLK